MLGEVPTRQSERIKQKPKLDPTSLIGNGEYAEPHPLMDHVIQFDCGPSFDPAGFLLF
jgi:hypothetical protein